MLHVIKDVLHLPLDAIYTVDVWATDTIRAELPPMVEWKEKADKIILDRWGIPVQHICAMQRERERVKTRHTYECPTSGTSMTEGGSEDMSENSTASRTETTAGAKTLSATGCPKKETYEHIFYREYMPKASTLEKRRARQEKLGLPVTPPPDGNRALRIPEPVQRGVVQQRTQVGIQGQSNLRQRTTDFPGRLSGDGVTSSRATQHSCPPHQSTTDFRTDSQQERCGARSSNGTHNSPPSIHRDLRLLSEKRELVRGTQEHSLFP